MHENSESLEQDSSQNSFLECVPKLALRPVYSFLKRSYLAHVFRDILAQTFPRPEALQVMQPMRLARQPPFSNFYITQLQL